MRARSLQIAIALLLLCTAAALGVTLWLHRGAAGPAGLRLRFHPFVGDEPLVLNQARYPNPGGSGRFAVRAFQFFVSNVRLRGASGDQGDHVETDSYHLVRFDDDSSEPVFEIVLPAVPPRSYSALEFGIGVDAAANGSVAQRGELDPNGRMAWTWDVGYKFVLFEGRLEGEGPATPLVYHVGFNENYRLVRAPLAGVAFDEGEPVTLDFRVDALSLFRGDNTIDLRTLSTVKFDHADAARLARNYARMITPMSPLAAGIHRRDSRDPTPGH